MHTASFHDNLSNFQKQDSAPLSQIPPFYFPPPSRAARDVRAAEEKFSLRMGTCYAVYPAEGMPQQAFVELGNLVRAFSRMYKVSGGLGW
jgi:hypothetical protein